MSPIMVLLRHFLLPAQQWAMSVEGKGFYMEEGEKAGNEEGWT